MKGDTFKEKIWLPYETCRLNVQEIKTTLFSYRLSG